MAHEYRIIEKHGQHEPQMLYNCGAVPGFKWFPLTKDGYWADPDAFSFGLISCDSLMAKEEAAAAILSARQINGGV